MMESLKEAGAPAVMTLKEAAKHAGRSYSTVWEHVTCGLLKGFRAGHGTAHWRVTRKALATYMVGGGKSYSPEL